MTFLNKFNGYRELNKKSAINKDKIDIYDLNSFIHSNFPLVITTSRKKEIVEKKMEVIISIFLNKKYFSKTSSPTQKKKSKLIFLQSLQEFTLSK